MFVTENLKPGTGCEIVGRNRATRTLQLTVHETTDQYGGLPSFLLSRIFKLVKGFFYYLEYSCFALSRTDTRRMV